MAKKFDLYVAKSHLLANQRCKNIDNLGVHRQLLIRSRNMQSSSFQLKANSNVWCADDYFLLIELAFQGNGWCLLPNHIADESVENGQLVMLPLEFEEMARQGKVDVVQHQRHNNTEVFKLLRQLLRNLL